MGSKTGRGFGRWGGLGQENNGSNNGRAVDNIQTYGGSRKRAARRPSTSETDKEVAFGMKQGTARDVVVAEAMTAGYRELATMNSVCMV